MEGERQETRNVRRRTDGGGADDPRVADVCDKIERIRALVAEKIASGRPEGDPGAGTSSDPNAQARDEEWVCAELARALVRHFPASEMDRMASRTSDLAADVVKLCNDDALSDNDATLADAAKAKLLRLLKLVHFMAQAGCTLRLSGRLLREVEGLDDAQDGAAAPGVSDDELAAGVARFVSVLDSEDEELTRFQRLLLYVLNMLYARGYKRYGEDCYEARTVEGRETYSWRRVCTIKEFVYAVTRKELNFEQWLNMTQNKGNPDSLVDYLVHSQDAQFPELRKDRHLHAFRNGVYVTRAGCFAEDPADEQLWPIRREVRDAFLPYSSTQQLPPNVTACKYHDLDFCADLAARPPGEWASIATPHLDSIVEFQEFEPEVRRWFYVLLGRLLYATGEQDGWQVMPYLKGQASSGKSTVLLSVCRNMYDAGDVGVLSNNIERKFGISALVDKMLFIAPEMKADLQLEQAEFQSMVSGEALQVAVKNQPSRTVASWRVPGIMAGNEVPGWIDNSGSIGRRLIVFGFTRCVTNGDAELGKKLEAEMPSILLKCNRAYQEAVRAVGSDNLWVHLPEYFHRMKQELTEATNPVQEFLSSDAVIVDMEDNTLGMPFKDLQEAYHAYCNENKISYTKTRGSMKSVLEHKRIHVNRLSGRSRDAVRYEYPRGSGRYVNVTSGWVHNVDLRKNCEPRDGTTGGGGGSLEFWE